MLQRRTTTRRRLTVARGDEGCIIVVMGLGQMSYYLISWADLYLLTVRASSYSSEGCEKEGDRRFGDSQTD